MPDETTLDFAVRASQRRVMAEAYRARAQATSDEFLRKIYAGLANTYDNIARELERVSTCIEAVNLATSFAKSKIVDRPRAENDGAAD